MRNPGPLDTATSVLNFAMAAGMLVGGYMLVTGPLKPLLDKLGMGLGGSIPDGTPPPIPPGSMAPCQPYPQGTGVHLDMSVYPTDPPRELGYPITFSGRLWMDRVVIQSTGLDNKRVELWEPGSCHTFFDYVYTDRDGNFTLTRPLLPNELDGYFVYGYFDGDDDFTLRVGAGQTGIWAVRPQ